MALGQDRLDKLERIEKIHIFHTTRSKLSYLVTNWVFDVKIIALMWAILHTKDKYEGLLWGWNQHGLECQDCRGAVGRSSCTFCWPGLPWKWGSPGCSTGPWKKTKRFGGFSKVWLPVKAWWFTCTGSWWTQKTSPSVWTPLWCDWPAEAWGGQIHLQLSQTSESGVTEQTYLGRMAPGPGSSGPGTKRKRLL